MVKKLIRWILNLFNKKEQVVELSPEVIEYLKQDSYATYNVYLEMERRKQNGNTRA